MKNLLLLSFLVILLHSCSETTPSKKVNQKPLQEEAIQTSKKEKLLRHIVMFKFKDEATPANVKEVEAEFAALKTHIPEVIGFEWGLNNSPEELNQGFTHCFFVSFENEAGREVYLPHPKHLEFVKMIGPLVDKALVFDYWTTE